MKLGKEQSVFLKPDVFNFSGKVAALEEKIVNSKDGKRSYKQVWISIKKGNDIIIVTDWDIYPCDINVGDMIIVSCVSKDDKITLSKIETL